MAAVTAAVRRLYFRLRSIEVEARELRAGDRLLFGFEGTEPYFSDPIGAVTPSLRAEFTAGKPRPQVVYGSRVWAHLPTGAVGYYQDVRVRVARPRVAPPGTSDHGPLGRMAATRNVMSRGEPGRLSSPADEEG